MRRTLPGTSTTRRGHTAVLGVRPSDTPTSPGLHTTRFDIDEGALAAGIGLLVHVVDGFLRRRETQ